MASTAQTIKFNVGGTRYEVSRSLLEAFPQTLLERSASKVWNEGGDEVFIEGNGHRFQYVLDFMRYGKITLPSSESQDAFLTEVEYYGLTSYLLAKVPSLYAIVKFNISGTIYEVPTSSLRIKKWQNTMLERKATRALNTGRNEVFIVGNGRRFQYVLDFLRLGKVDLPLNESREEVLRDLRQYQIPDTDSINLLGRDSVISKSGLRDFNVRNLFTS